MSAFEKLKKSRGKSLDAFASEIAKDTKKKYGNDETFWKITRDQADNGSAVIRFLDNGDEPNFVKLWKYGFKGENGWYFENSPYTIGQKDPASEHYFELRKMAEDTKDPALDKLAQNRSSKLNYYSNILVVKDPARPENNGKVFRFEYGKKIFAKIKAFMELQLENDPEDRINPFDLFDGVNFRLRVKKENGFITYDDSQFDTRSGPIADSDEEIEAIWNTRHSLSSLVAPDQFKTYDELKARLDIVLGRGGSSTPTGGSSSGGRFKFDDEDEDEAPKVAESKFDLSSKFDDEPEIPAAKPATSPKVSSKFDDDEDDDEYFAQFANKR